MSDRLERAKQVAQQAAEKAKTQIIPAGEAARRTLSSYSAEYDDWAGRKIVLSPQEVRQFFSPKASDADIVKFIHTCKSYRLNPFLGDAYLVKYTETEPAQIIVARFVFMRIAQSHPNYRGFKSGVIVVRPNPDRARKAVLNKLIPKLKALAEEVPDAKASILELIVEAQEIEQKLMEGDVETQEVEGAFVPPGWRLYGGWCVVYLERNGQKEEVWQRVLFQEYNREKASWKTMPATMIQKVAEAQAFRKAFPDLLSPLYIPEEMGAERLNGAVVKTEEVEQSEVTNLEDLETTTE